MDVNHGTNSTTIPDSADTIGGLDAVQDCSATQDGTTITADSYNGIQFELVNAFIKGGYPLAPFNPADPSTYNKLWELLSRTSSHEDGKGDALVAVKQPYEGAKEITQHDKNKEIVSIHDFPSISIAAAAAVAHGIKIYIPAGDHLSNLDSVDDDLFYGFGRLVDGEGRIVLDTAKNITQAEAVTQQITIDDKSKGGSLSDFGNKASFNYYSPQVTPIDEAYNFNRASQSTVFTSSSGVSVLDSDVLSESHEPNYSGILIGSAGDNLMPDQNLNGGDWALSNGSVTQSTVAAPDGTMTAWRITDSSGTASDFPTLSRNVLSEFSDGETITCSFFVRSDENPLSQFQTYHILSGGSQSHYSKSRIFAHTGQKSADDENCRTVIKPVKDNWYLVIQTFTNTSVGNTDLNFQIRTTWPDVASIGEYIDIWRPTVHRGDMWLGVQQSRLGDILEREIGANTNVRFNPDKGILAVKYAPMHGGEELRVLAQLDDGTDNKVISIYVSDDSDLIVGRVKNGADQTQIFFAGGQGRDGGEVAIQWNAGVLTGYFNGSKSVNTGLITADVTGINKMLIGANRSGKQPNTIIESVFLKDDCLEDNDIGLIFENKLDEISPSLIELNNAAKNEGLNLAQRRRFGIAKPSHGYNIVGGFGQSLMFADDTAAPPLTTDAVDDVLMLGDSVRSQTTDAVFTPHGSGLNSAKATADFNTTLADQAYLDANARNWNVSLNGESPIVAAIQQAKTALNNMLFMSNTVKFVIGVIAKGESTLATIGNTSGNTYKRGVDWYTKVKSEILGIDSSANISVPISLMMHGEADKDATGSDYVDGLKDYFDNQHTDINQALFSQKDRTMWFVSAASKRWATDHQRVPNAMIELEREIDHMIIAMPSYALQSGPTYDSAGEHPTGNGSREAGAIFGRAIDYHNRGLNFFCPRIVAGSTSGKQIILGIAAMQYPIQVKPVWGSETFNKEIIANYGYTASDSAGDLSILSVDVQDALIILNCDREASGTVTVVYAGQTGSRGRGNICDNSSYYGYHEYKVDDNQYAGENISTENNSKYVGYNYALPQTYEINA